MTLASAPPAPYGVMPAGTDNSQWRRQQEYSNFRNLLIGGDFTTNPWQRNVAGLATTNVIASAVANTVTYFADRWFAVGGASSSILMAKVADTSVAGFGSSLKVSRTASNTNTAAFNVGQVVSTGNSTRAQGQQVTLSFWAKAGANYSGGDLTVQVVSGTGTNQSAANMVAGSWTTQATPVNTTQTLTTTMTRYTFTSAAIVPATVTQLGVLLQWTPVGTAGADDSITLNGLQLEIGSNASDFEHRDSKTELDLCLHHSWVIAEPASGVVVGMGGAVASANVQVFYIATPVQMRTAPTVTLAAGSFKVCVAAAAAAATSIAAGTTHTPNAISITTGVTETVGLVASLQGGGGSGYILASSEF